jgi:hypothetical protein
MPESTLGRKTAQMLKSGRWDAKVVEANMSCTSRFMSPTNRSRSDSV